MVVPAFRLVPRTSSSSNGAGFGSNSGTGATFECTPDLAELVASTADDCLKLSSFCLMSALLQEGQECAVDPNGGDSSVMIRQGFLDVASVVASRVIDSDNIQTECLQPTLESAQCLALMQERLNNGTLTVVLLEYIPLSDSEPISTPPPVKIDLYSPSPVAAAVSPSSMPPVTSPPVSSVPSVAPITSVAITSAPTAAPLQSIVEMVPTELPLVATSAPRTLAPQTKPKQPTVPSRDSEQADGNSSPDIETGSNGSSSNNSDEMGVIIGAVVGACIFILFLFCLGTFLWRRRSRNHTSSNRKNHDTEGPVTDGVTTNKATQPHPPNEIDIEKGLTMDETEDDNSCSSNRLRQHDGNDLWDEPWSLASRPIDNQRHISSQRVELERRVDTSDDDDDDADDSRQNEYEFGEDNCSKSEVPEYDEILSTGSSSIAYTLGSGASSTIFSGTGGGGTDTTEFDGYTCKSVKSADLTTMQTIMDQHQAGQSHRSSPTEPSYHAQSGTNASDSSSVASESTIDSEDPELAVGHRMFQPNSWLTRSDRLIPAAQQAAAAVAPPETSQADF